MAVELLDGDKEITVRDCDLRGVDDGDAETTYTVKQIPNQVRKNAQKKHSKMVKGQYVIDNEAIVEELLEYALVRWTGIQHKGKDAPCESVYKQALDPIRKAALIGVAGFNRIAQDAADKEDSFRSPA